jgi:replicative DNA helicase
MTDLVDSLSNISLEQMILGIIIKDNNSYDLVNNMLKGEMFSHNRHVFLYDHFVSLFRNGHPVNMATLYPIIMNNIHYGLTIEYVEEIIKNAYGKENLVKYCESLRDMFLRRKVLEILNGGHNRLAAFSLEQSAESIIEGIEREIFEVVDRHETKSIYNIGDSALNFVNKISKRIAGEITGIDTGFHSINELLGGLHRGELVILAGRPSMGKTAYAVNLGINIAKNKKQKNSVLFFSLEMPEEQITMRILSGETGINSFKIRSGHQSTEETARLFQKAREIKELKFFTDDYALNTITNMLITSRRIKRIHGLDVILVDYLQLIKMENTHGSNENRTLELARITQGLKSIAKELNVCIIALSQLSRAVENRDDKRPQLSDLRESGSIEQDADVVMFIYREEYYLKRKEPKGLRIESNEQFSRDKSSDSKRDRSREEEWMEWKALFSEAENCAEIIVDKNRNGSIGVVKLFYDMSTSVFKDL